MKKKNDILIVGAGLNGSALTIALAQSGQSVTLIDALSRKEPSIDHFDGRAYALAIASKRLLQAINIWKEVSEFAQPILEIKVTDGRIGQGPSPLWMHFDHGEIEEGPMGFMVEDRHLRQAFLNAITERGNITYIHGQKVVHQDVRPHEVTIHLDDGQEICGSVLIGSDGYNSSTARRAQLSFTQWHYDQSSLVCTLEHQKSHNGVAHQLFLPSGPLAILPLTGHRSSVVWTEQSQAAQQINAMDDDQYLDELRPRFGRFLGEISLEGERYIYPLQLKLANKFIAQRIALIGEAAHTIHPIAGQGLNAGLRDVGALAEVLIKARRRGEDIGSIDVLQRYQQWRRFDSVSLALATDMFNRLFSNDIPIVRSLRDIGMGLVNHLPSLRRSLIREAAGLTGDLPQLNQGREI